MKVGVSALLEGRTGSTSVSFAFDVLTASPVLQGNGPAAQALGLTRGPYLGWEETGADLRAGAAMMNLDLARRDTRQVLWGAIRQGTQDAQIDAWATVLRPLAPRVIALAHEPTPLDGSYADLKAAVSRVVTRWRAAGVTQHILAQCLVDGAYRNESVDDRLAPECDAVGVDGYGDVRKGLFTATDVFGPTLAYARSHDKQVAIFETSFHDATDAQDIAYFDSLDAYMKANTVIACGLYLVDNRSIGGRNDAPTPGGLAVLQRMALDPFYGRTLG